MSINIQNKFKKDLLVGQTAEKDLAYSLLQDGWTVTFNTSPTNEIKQLKKYDLTAAKDEKQYTIEVKTDLMYMDTKRVAVEIKCVLESEADYFIYQLGNEFWTIKTIDLIKEVTNKDNRGIYKFLNGGDSNKTQLALFKLDYFKTIFQNKTNKIDKVKQPI